MSRQSRALAFSLLLACAGGCVTEQHHEFRGTLSRGAAPPTGPATWRLGGQFGYREEGSADAVTGFHLGQLNGIILFLHDRRRFDSSGYRMSNDAVSAVYFAEWSGGRGEAEPWKAFVALDEAARERAEGVHRLRGSFNVERWKSNLDFRVRLAMRSEGSDSVAIEGVLASDERLEFRPLDWVGRMLVSVAYVVGVI